MPQLESLWIKDNLWPTVNPPSDWGTVKGRSGIPQDIRLPKLKLLAVSVPGIMNNLIPHLFWRIYSWTAHMTLMLKARRQTMDGVIEGSDRWKLH